MDNLITSGQLIIDHVEASKQATTLYFSIGIPVLGLIILGGIYFITKSNFFAVLIAFFLGLGTCLFMAIPILNSDSDYPDITPEAIYTWNKDVEQYINNLPVQTYPVENYSIKGSSMIINYKDIYGKTKEITTSTDIESPNKEGKGYSVQFQYLSKDIKGLWDSEERKEYSGNFNEPAYILKSKIYKKGYYNVKVVVKNK